LIAPLPNITFNFFEFLNWIRRDWHELMTFVSSFCYLILSPYYIYGFLYFKRSIEDRKIIFITVYISSILLFFAIAFGNQIIQERYRLMAIPLFLTGALLGYSIRKMVKYKFIKSLCYSIFFFASVAFYLYKSL